MAGEVRASSTAESRGSADPEVGGCHLCSRCGGRPSAGGPSGDFCALCHASASVDGVLAHTEFRAPVILALVAFFQALAGLLRALTAR